LAVAVKAWPESRETSREGDCPLFGDRPLDSIQSNGRDGRFQLKVDAKKNPTYTITYCAANYYPRADRDLPSRSRDVIPNPVRMHPLTQGRKLDEDVVTRETLSALNNLAYLRSINPDQFDTIVRTLGRTEGLPAVIREFGQR
jgi:hypothetical protein